MTEGRNPGRDGNPAARGRQAGAPLRQGNGGPIARRGEGQGPAAGSELIEVRRRGAETRPTIVLDDLWAPVRPGRAQEDRAFLPEPIGLLEAPASRFKIGLLYSICAIVTLGLLASWFGHLDVYADASGLIQAAGDTKVVQPLQGGQVVALRVHDGDRVNQGDILVELDPTTALADQILVKQSLDNDRAEIVRRQAAIDAAGKSPIDTQPKVAWPETLPAPVREREEQSLRSDLASLAAAIANLMTQRTATEAERDKYQASIGPQQGVVDLVGEAEGMGSEMFKGGWNSRLTLLTMQQQLQSAKLQLVTLQGSLAQAKAAIVVIDTAIAQTLQSFVNTNRQALLTAQQTEESLVQNLAKATSTLNNMTLRASASGVITASAVTTLGQVVTAGEQVMQIVPDGGPLEIECYVLNTDAGFIRLGQKATIKVDTFDYTRYGTISGRVVQIAKDAMTGKQALQLQKNSASASSATGSGSITAPAQQTSDLVFPVIIAPDRTTMDVGGRSLPLTAGMTVVVEIKTQSRRAIDYILSPIQSSLGTTSE